MHLVQFDELNNYCLTGAVDTDGVLIPISSFNKKECEKLFNKKAIKPNSYDIREMYELNKFQYLLFGLLNFEKYCKQEPIEGMSEVLKELKEYKIKFHNVTARKFVTSSILGKRYRKILLKWLEKYFKNVFTTVEFCDEKTVVRDKFLACHKLNADFIIEDSADKEIVLNLANKGFKVFLIDALYNQNITHPNITRIYNPNQLKEEILKLYHEKQNRNIIKPLPSKEERILTGEEKEKYVQGQKRYFKSLTINENYLKKGEKRFKLLTKIPFLICKLLGFKVIGKENIPYQDGILITPNHLNQFDQYIVSYAMRNKTIYGLAAKSIENTFRGKLFRFTGCAVFIDRKDEDSRQHGKLVASALLSQGKNFVIFPEGTRKNKNDEGKSKDLLPFKDGSIIIAQNTGAPILPVAINYKNKTITFDKCILISENACIQEENKKLEDKIHSMVLDRVVK